MKLYEHPDFEAIVTQAREHLAIPGLSEQLIEKDYFVTEVLRVVAASLPSQAVFKGGTSLSIGPIVQRAVARLGEEADGGFSTGTALA